MRRVLVSAAVFGWLGCGSWNDELPRAAAARPSEPTVVPSPSDPACDARTLARSAPWAGHIAKREPTSYQLEHWQVLYDRTVLCAGLGPLSCNAWAEKRLARAAASQTAGAVQARVERGEERRGTMWSVTVDGRPENHLYRTHRDFSTFLHRLADAGSSVDVTERMPVVEPRASRVRMKLVSPTRSAVPAETWQIELEDSELAVLDVGLALDDLADRGIAIDPTSRAEFDRLAGAVSPRATTGYVMTPLFDGTGTALRATLVVYCAQE